MRIYCSYAYDLDSPFHRAAAAWWTNCLSNAEPVGLAQVILFLVTDAQLAAFALEYRATVHTADTDFQRFPGVSWSNPITGAKG
jgi:predicted nucleic acid-binding protein